MTLERWQTLSWRDQIGHIASEIKRCQLAKNKDENLYLSILEQAINLVDLSLNDPRWRSNPLPLLVLRGELAKIYIGESQNLEKIYKSL
jgi:hypothetical protein